MHPGTVAAEAGTLDGKASSYVRDALTSKCWRLCGGGGGGGTLCLGQDGRLAVL